MRSPQCWLEALLHLQSPTYHEAQFHAWLREEVTRIAPQANLLEVQDSLIVRLPWQADKPHVALVGHSDVVPTWFTPYVHGQRMYGAGASDMKGALAAFFWLLERHGMALTQRYNLSWIVYAREEMTPLQENGLFSLIQHFPEYFNTLDLAVVGEPTDNTIQIGCVGSIHMCVTVLGQACHSARPWNGCNALYRALPLIQTLAAWQPRRQTIFGVDFYDVIQITESQSEPGRTSLPGWWKANVNYRFAPIHSQAVAEAELRQILLSAGITDIGLELVDAVDAGRVLDTPLFRDVIAQLQKPIQAKQAWTDVAQLTARGIPAFNYGPGLTAQAHQREEYLDLTLLEDYIASLERLLLA